MNNIYSNIIDNLPTEPVVNSYDRVKHIPFTDGENIICYSEEQANAIADLFDSLGYQGITSCEDDGYWLVYVD